jgi:hypothetical protein
MPEVVMERAVFEEPRLLAGVKLLVRLAVEVPLLDDAIERRERRLVREPLERIEIVVAVLLADGRSSLSALPWWHHGRNATKCVHVCAPCAYLVPIATPPSDIKRGGTAAATPSPSASVVGTHTTAPT